VYLKILGFAVSVYGDKIRNGEVNSTPRSWNPDTGLSGLNK